MTLPASSFRELVVRRRDACVKFKDGKPARHRREALDFYNGKNLDVYGDSGDGLSSVVSRDVMEAIESVMPPLLRPFVAGEEVVSFDPVEAQDEKSTKQATEYVNHVFRRHNNVLHVAQTALKDGLLLREGIAKTVTEEVAEGGPETFAGLSQDELTALRVRLAAEGRDVVGDIAQDQATGAFSVIVPPKKVRKYRVHIVAPGRFLREEGVTSLEKGGFFGDRDEVSVADLIAMGVPEQKAKALKPGRPDSGLEKRDDEEERGSDEAEWDESDLSRMVWVDDCYVRCDYNKTGVIEWRKVLLGGSETTILSDEPYEGHPYSHWTPIPLPHQLTGLSYFDLTRDIQINKTAFQREFNNAMYLANRPMREVVDGQVNIDDLLNPSVGGIVRVKQQGMVSAMPSGGEVAFGAILQGVEYLDGQREARTGVTRYNQGMDSNSLNKTATGMNIISSNSQQRQELVARQFGEFLKDIFQKLLDLVSRHASPEEVAKLTGSFVPWPTSYDAIVSVGLGTNNKDQLVGHLTGLMQLDERIIQLQQGMNGPFLYPDNIYEKLKRYVEAMGLKGDKYYSDPSHPPKQALPAPAAEEPAADPLAEPRLKAETEIAKEHIRQDGKLAVEEMRQQSQVVPFPVSM